MDDMSGTRGGNGVRRTREQTGDGERRGWSPTSLPTADLPSGLDAAQSTHDARKGAGEMTSCQQAMKETLITGTGFYLPDKRRAIVRTLKEQGYLKGVSAPTDTQIREACAERLLLVKEQYLTARKDVLDVILVARAREARDGAIAAAERRATINTSPPGGLAAVKKPPMTPHEAVNPMPDGSRGL